VQIATIITFDQHSSLNATEYLRFAAI